jgi:hypothetical protein
MIRSSGLALVAALVVSFSGCTAIDQISATQDEKLLQTAGFKVVPGDTPERIQALDTLAPGKISRIGRGGTIYYVYADPNECRCLWVGNQAQYERYQRLVMEEMVPEVEMVVVESGPDWSLDMEAW